MRPITANDINHLINRYTSLKSVQKLEAVKVFLIAISEVTSRLSLSIYRWKALSEQNMNISKYFNNTLLS